MASSQSVYREPPRGRRDSAAQTPAQGRAGIRQRWATGAPSPASPGGQSVGPAGGVAAPARGVALARDRVALAPGAGVLRRPTHYLLLP